MSRTQQASGMTVIDRFYLSDYTNEFITRKKTNVDGEEQGSTVRPAGQSPAWSAPTATSVGQKPLRAANPSVHVLILQSGAKAFTSV